MFRPSKRPAHRLRAGLTLPELLVAIASLGVLGCLVFTYNTQNSSADAPVISQVTVSAVPPVACVNQSDISLQETLDRLGYTVNVPHSFHGSTVAPREYRVSTADDSVMAGHFSSRGPVTFQEVSRQSALGSVTRFIAENEQGTRLNVFEPLSDTNGSFMDSQEGRTATCSLPDEWRFCIDFPPSNGFTHGPLYSTPDDNPGSTWQLMVLPARTGGKWVDEGENTGHWEGGADTGDYLLCWEDLAGGGDHDYQDLVVLARGLTVVDRD